MQEGRSSLKARRVEGRKKEKGGGAREDWSTLCNTMYELAALRTRLEDDNSHDVIEMRYQAGDGEYSHVLCWLRVLEIPTVPKSPVTDLRGHLERGSRIAFIYIYAPLPADSPARIT